MYKSENELTADFLNHLENELSKIEGTYNYDIGRAAAYLTRNLYDALEIERNRTFIETATEDEDIERHAAEFRTYRRESGKAVGVVTITGKAGTIILANTIILNRFGIKYRTVSSLLLNTVGTGDIGIEALEGGIIGNCDPFEIVSFEIANVNVYTVTNNNSISEGYDIESNSSLVERTKENARKPAHSGNANSYIQWAKEVTGVGEARVIPLWNGNGTVKVLISDYSLNEATPTLVATVSNYINEKRPIGADVTVESLTPIHLNLSIGIVLEVGYLLASVREDIIINLKLANIEERLTRIDSKDTVVLNKSAIMDAIIHTDGVEDCKIDSYSLENVPIDNILQISELVNVYEY